MNLKNSVFLFVILISLFSCGGDGGDDTLVVSGPSNLVFEANIVGQDETHPNGDGSGTITLNFSADNTKKYEIDMGDGEPVQSTSLNELTYIYTGAGIKTFEIKIYAYNGFEFIVSPNISVTVQIGTGTGTGTGWNLVWYDEFDVDGAINSNNWFHQTQLPAGGNWYNNEVQHYTNRTDNSYVSDGTLKIVAKKESFTDQGQTKQYTSARLNSKFAFTYGKVEVRAKLPTGSGTWPAIWMLGKNINEDGGYWDNEGFGTTGWPACGEIDIMEHWGSNQNFVQSAMHTPSSFGATENHGGQTIATVSSEFHTYALEWTEEEMVFSVDDVVHYTYNPIPKDSSTWPFAADQYIILNIALEPSVVGSFVQSSMEIDYVRVYQ